MKLKENKFVKKYLENEKSIFEMIALSFVGALALTAIFLGSFKEVNRVGFVGEVPLFRVAIVFSIEFIFMGILYLKQKTYAKILMFLSVLVYFLLVAYSTSNMDFASITNNPAGKEFYLAFVGVLCVIAFLYVKEDLFKTQEKIKISDKGLVIATIAIGAFVFIITTIVGVLRYKSFSAPSFDFGVFAQAFEYMRKTGVLKTVVERGYELPHYAVHVSPIFYLALPIYMIAPRAETVAVIQSIMIALPVLPIYLLGKHYKLSNKVIVVILAVYSLFPATISGTFYDIHENCFLTFMILMLVWAVEKKKNILMIVFALFTLFVKEDAAMYVMILGAFWICSRKDKTRGLLLIGISAVYFIIAVNIIRSFGFEIQNYRLGNMFYDQKGNFSQIIRVILTDPGYIFTQFFANAKTETMDKIPYLIEMFVPIGILIFTTGKKYSRYILLASLFLLGVAPIYVYQHDIGFQYNFGHIALVIYLIIMNVSDMKHKKRKVMLVSSFIICAVMFMGLVFPKASYYAGTYRSQSTTISKLDKACSLVPSDKSVFTTGWLMPHLSKNLQCYDISYLDDKHKEGVPEYPEYLLVDERETDAISKFAPYINSGKYEVALEEKQDGGGKLVTLYKLK